MSLPLYIFVFPPSILAVLIIILLTILTYRAFKEPLPTVPANTDAPSLDTYSYAQPVLPQPLPKEVTPIAQLIALEKKANALWRNYPNNDENNFWKKYEQLLKKVNK